MADTVTHSPSDDLVTCVYCEYEWEYSGSMKRATCPSCGRKTPVEE